MPFCYKPDFEKYVFSGFPSIVLSLFAATLNQEFSLRLSVVSTYELSLIVERFGDKIVLADRRRL